MRKIVVLLLCLLSVPAAALAQAVSYTVSVPKPTSSLLHVVMDVRGVTGPSVDVAMPAWSPGSYNLHWAAKNVQRFTAQDASGRALAAAMVDTSVWRVKPAASTMRITYDVYMGASFVNDTHATIVGTRSLMFLVGRTPYPAPGVLTITVEAPAGWKLA